MFKNKNNGISNAFENTKWLSVSNMIISTICFCLLLFMIFGIVGFLLSINLIGICYGINYYFLCYKKKDISVKRKGPEWVSVGPINNSYKQTEGYVDEDDGEMEKYY